MYESILYNVFFSITVSFLYSFFELNSQTWPIYNIIDIFDRFLQVYYQVCTGKYIFLFPDMAMYCFRGATETNYWWTEFPNTLYIPQALCIVIQICKCRTYTFLFPVTTTEMLGNKCVPVSKWYPSRKFDFIGIKVGC